jgi:DNA-binding NarL/FixJ family response regulator
MGGIREMRVLLVDDHPVVRHALCALFADEPDIEIVGEAADGQGAIALTHQLHPDLVLMDVSLPGMDGIRATRAIHATLPATCVIGHSTFARDRRAEAMRDAGAMDYVPKGAPGGELLLVMRACHARLCEDRPRLFVA